MLMRGGCGPARAGFGEAAGKLEGNSMCSDVKSFAATADAGSLAGALGQANAWPFEEARKILRRIEATGQTEVLFETGYGPSALPHIVPLKGTLSTNMVRNAF